MPGRAGDNVILPRRLRGQVVADPSGYIPADVGVAIPDTDLCRIQRWCRERVPEHLWAQVKVEAGEEIIITVAGRPSARLVAARPVQWRAWDEIADLVREPGDSDWGRDPDLVDADVRDPEQRDDGVRRSD